MILGMDIHGYQIMYTDFYLDLPLFYLNIDLLTLFFPFLISVQKVKKFSLADQNQQEAGPVGKNL